MYIMTLQGWKPLRPLKASKPATFKDCQAVKDLNVHMATAFKDKDARLKAFARNVLKMRHTHVN